MLRKMYRTRNRLLIGLALLLAVTACTDSADSVAINEPGIARVVKEVNRAHNGGVLNMAQLGEHYQAVIRYTDGQPLTRGIGALGAFYADNLGQIYREFITLQEQDAFLRLHTTVKTGEGYTEEPGAFAGEDTLAALKQHQQSLLLRYGD